ncbi:MAG TPA: orotidine-5'-phosphate decarboxylase [Dehalococcoidia bacterium]|nr:orotidine-5'-phosphate decarboxylase [Dehalococcoidia bacterium]
MANKSQSASAGHSNGLSQLSNTTGHGDRREPGGTSFAQKYKMAADRNNSLLCVGLDPRPDLMPDDIDPFEFIREVIDATRDFVCAYKPNAAFFEAFGPDSWKFLANTIENIKDLPDAIPVLLDGKRGDIGETSAFYAHAMFQWLGADAVTVNPYLGQDALEPFFDYENQHTFVVCLNSNPGASQIQLLELAGTQGSLLYQHVAGLANDWNSQGAGNVGLVVGATYPRQAREIRDLCPDLLMLVPGVGFQGGDVQEAVTATLNDASGGILVNASRSVLYAGREHDDYRQNFARYARAAAERLRDQINEARQTTAVAPEAVIP